MTEKGDAGEVDAPAGKPVIATFTELLKPFCPVIETVKLLVLPAVPVIVAGDAVIPKSGVGTVSESAAECASEPDVPLTVTAYVPGVAVVGIDKLTAWLPPATTENGAAGELDTPAGNPVMAMLTELLNPFCPLTDTVKFRLVLPTVPVIVPGDTLIAKS